MKRIIYNNRILAIAFLTVFSLGTLAAQATDDAKALPIELRYTGHVNNHPLYKLIVKGSADHDEFTIIIRDENKSTLFSENIKGESFTKSFLLNTEELGEATLQFEVVSKRSGRSVTYAIDRNTHFEEEMVITAVK